MGGVPLYDPQARRLRRTRLSQSREVELDSQGRILIPKNLKDVTGITDSAVIIGVGPFFEVWEPTRYRTYFQSADSQYDDDLTRLDRLRPQGNRPEVVSGTACGQNPKTEPQQDDVSRAGDGQ